MTKDYSKVTIALVTYNAEKYLRQCLLSIKQQTYTDWQILIIDNGSSDGTVRYIKENYPHWKYIESKQNLGFSKAYNQIISWTKSDYILCVNQDTLMDENYLAELVKYMDQNAQVGSVAGKLYNWDFNNNIKTRIIDSAGLRIFKNHRIADIAQGENDESDKYSSIVEVFGVSGALPLYRRQALENIMIKNKLSIEYFDEDFFMYKEDVDLAFRLRLNGWSSYMIPSAIAYHNRSTADTGAKTNWQIAKAHRNKNRLINFLSYRNHIFVIFKNEFRKNIFKYFMVIGFYEFKKFIFMKLFNRVKNAKFKGILKLWPIMKNKREQVKSLTKISPEQLADWYDK